MQSTYIYGLRDPRDWRIRYIGRTAWPFAKRMSSHLHVRNPRHYTRRENWIQKLISIGLKPTMEFLECVPGNGFESERNWIAKFRNMGHELVNGNDGGTGVVMGHVQRKKRGPYPEHSRRKLSEANKGKPVHPNFAASWERRRGRIDPRDLVERRAATNRERGKNKGECHPLSRLTEEKVREIRALYATGKYGRIEIASRFGVSRTCIYHVLKGDRWGWLT